MVSCLGNFSCPKSKLICRGFPLDCRILAGAFNLIIST
jgi:hypothetical protein